MAAPTFHAKQNGGGSAAANVTVTVPTNTDGDILLFFMAKDDTGAVTWPGGWNILVEGTANGYYGGVGWRRASSEPANYTWTFTSIWRNCVMVSYTGAVANENPLDPDTPPAQVETANSTTLATNTNTTTLADAMAVAFHQNINVTTWSAAPGGWTARNNTAGDEAHWMDQAFATAQGISATQSWGGSGGASKAYILALQSLPTDQHYFPPPAFPGVFNLDARRMI